MDTAEIKSVFTGCSFEKTDGFRYVQCAADNAPIIGLMERLGMPGEAKGKGQVEFQLTEGACSVQGEDGQAVWRYVAEQTEDLPYG